MGTEHYVAYRSISTMRRPCQAATSFGFFSGKSESFLRQVIGQTVWVIASRGKPRSLHKASRHHRQCTQTPFTFRGKAENSLYVLTTQLREIGEYCLLIHAARQIFEYIGDGDARSLHAWLATPDAGGN